MSIVPSLPPRLHLVEMFVDTTLDGCQFVSHLLVVTLEYEGTQQSGVALGTIESAME